MNSTASIVSKVLSFCDILRDDDVGYGDYLEQLTYGVRIAHVLYIGDGWKFGDL